MWGETGKGCSSVVFESINKNACFQKFTVFKLTVHPACCLILAISLLCTFLSRGFKAFFPLDSKTTI